jgi:hypothetical protein
LSGWLSVLDLEADLAAFLNWLVLALSSKPDLISKW